jgi:hypothetical protein
MHAASRRRSHILTAEARNFHASERPGVAASAHTETIHTTANHPWLTVERGWVLAGALPPGEWVVTLNGA